VLQHKCLCSDFGSWNRRMFLYVNLSMICRSRQVERSMFRVGMDGGLRNGVNDTRLKLRFSSQQGSVMSQISEVGIEELSNGSSPKASRSTGGYSGILVSSGMKHPVTLAPRCRTCSIRSRCGSACPEATTTASRPRQRSAVIDKFLLCFELWLAPR